MALALLIIDLLIKFQMIVPSIASMVAIIAAASIYPCDSFQLGRHSIRSLYLPTATKASRLQATDDTTIQQEELDREIAQQFTIQVCTSTSCTKKLKQLGLDQYHVLGEIYAYAQSANLETCMVIEDGGCNGGKNCQMGPCVSIQHEDFVGNVALEGMNSNEFRERV